MACQSLRREQHGRWGLQRAVRWRGRTLGTPGFWRCACGCIPWCGHPAATAARPGFGPMPVMSFSASAACMLPMMPTSGESTPRVAHCDFLKLRVGVEQAGVAGRFAVARVKHGDLRIEPDGRAADQRDAVAHAGGVHQRGGCGSCRSSPAPRYMPGQQGIEQGGIGALRRWAQAAPAGLMVGHGLGQRGHLRAGPRGPWCGQSGAAGWSESTASSSTTVIWPTPLAARYSAAGAPRPPAPKISTWAAQMRSCPSMPISSSRMWRE